MFGFLTQSVDRSFLPPTPDWILPGFYAVILASILLPPHPRILRLAPGAAIFALLYHLIFGTQGYTAADYGVATSGVGLVYRWLDLMVFHEPERDFWKVSSGNSNGQIVRAPSSPWARFKWFFELFIAQRGIGWNIKPTKSVPPGTKDRKLFLKDSIVHFIRVYVFYEVSTFILRNIYEASYWQPLFEMSMPKQILIAWITGLSAYAGIEIFYTLLSLVCVGMYMSPPDSFPPISGAFRCDAWSVRQMWGVCWHQMVRRPCGEAGKGIKNLLGLRTGGLLSKYTQVFVAFALSALMHHVGAIKNQWADGGLHQALYFMMQPLAYMLEDFVMYVGQEMGIKSSRILSLISLIGGFRRTLSRAFCNQCYEV